MDLKELPTEAPKAISETPPTNATAPAASEKHQPHNRRGFFGLFGGGDKEGVNEEAKPLSETKPQEVVDEGQKIANEANDTNNPEQAAADQATDTSSAEGLDQPTIGAAENADSSSEQSEEALNGVSAGRSEGADTSGTEVNDTNSSEQFGPTSESADQTTDADPAGGETAEGGLNQSPFARTEELDDNTEQPTNTEADQTTGIGNTTETAFSEASSTTNTGETDQASSEPIAEDETAHEEQPEVSGGFRNADEPTPETPSQELDGNDDKPEIPEADALDTGTALGEADTDTAYPLDTSSEDLPTTDEVKDVREEEKPEDDVKDGEAKDEEDRDQPEVTNDETDDNSSKEDADEPEAQKPEVSAEEATEITRRLFRKIQKGGGDINDPVLDNLNPVGMEAADKLIDNAPVIEEGVRRLFEENEMPISKQDVDEIVMSKITKVNGEDVANVVRLVHKEHTDNEENAA